jgi:putative ABC transport system permease protein
MRVLLKDLRYDFRTLLRRPAFTVVALLTLALGIGANTAIFSVVNGVLLRPLPFKDPERLVQVWEKNLKRGFTQDTVSPQNFEDWQEQSRSFDAMAAYEYESFVLTNRDAPERLVGILASSAFIDVLGIKPALGRGFLPGEDRRGAERVVLLSDRLWRRSFGGRADALGQAVILNGESYVVVGVMPSDFSFPNPRLDLWVPSIDLRRPRGDHFMFAVARLKPTVGLKQAQEEIDVIARRLGEQYPGPNGNSGVTLVPLQEEIVGKARPALLMLLGAVALMLLIACVNVANLLLARATARSKEIAVRAALGASRLRLVRQLLTESLVLALAGGGAGLLLSVWGVNLIVVAGAGTIPRAGEIGVDARAFGFTLAVSVLTGLLFGLAPALNSSAPELSSSLKEGSRGAGVGPRQGRAQGVLIVTEVALAFVLLASAGLLLKSYARLRRVDPGFRAEQVLTARLALPAAKYPEADRQAIFYQQALERIRTLPGVQQAGVVSDLPFSGSRSGRSFDIEGHATSSEPDAQTPHADYRKISPDYFRAIGIRLVRGREFTERDGKDAPGVAIVNEACARRFFPGEEPLGRWLVYGNSGQQVRREIVGVVADVKHESLADERAPEVYVPFAQHPQSEMFFAVRTASDPESFAAPLRNAVLEVDRDLPVYSVLTLRQRLENSVAPQRFDTLLLAVFAAVAMLMAAVGVFGVMSYTVAQRTHELGVRVALGARRRDILRLVVGRGMRLALAGVGLGLAAAFALTRLLTRLLYEVEPTDPLIFAGIAGLLASVALLACYLPARRATKVDPMVALRYE